MAPFGPASLWNMPLTRSATYTPIPGLAKLAVGFSDPPDSLPIYVAAASDPLRQVLYSPDTWQNVASGAWKRFGNSTAVEAAILKTTSAVFPSPGNPYSSQSTTSWVLPASYDRLVNPSGGLVVNLSNAVVPETGSDGHIAVYQPSGRVFEAEGAIRLSSGQLVCLQYHLTDPNGAGDGAANGVTASMLPVYAGVITAADLAAGAINHAVKIVVPPGILKPTWVAPALAFDRDAMTNSPPYSGLLPMGSRLAIPPSVNVGATSPLGKMIATTAQRRGFIIADRGGSGITVEVQGNGGTALAAAIAAAQGDLVKIVHAAQAVTGAQVTPWSIWG